MPELGVFLFPSFFPHFWGILPWLFHGWQWHFVVINWLGRYHQEVVGSPYIYDKVLFMAERGGEMGKKHPFFVLNSPISRLFGWNRREQCYIFAFSFRREALKGPNQTLIGAFSSANERVFEAEGLIIPRTSSSRHQNPTIPGLAVIFTENCVITTSTRLCNTQNLSFFFPWL